MRRGKKYDFSFSSVALLLISSQFRFKTIGAPALSSSLVDFLAALTKSGPFPERLWRQEHRAAGHMALVTEETASLSSQLQGTVPGRLWRQEHRAAGHVVSGVASSSAVFQQPSLRNVRVCLLHVGHPSLENSSQRTRKIVSTRL